MRRQIGNAALPVKDPAVAFCPVFERYPTSLAPPKWAVIVTAFSKQVLLFDLVTWGTQATPNPAPPTPGGSPTYTFTASPSGSATQFAFSVDNTNGLTLRNLQLQNLPDSSRGQAIASLIEFTGIAVTFGADSALAFDWGAVSTDVKSGEQRPNSGLRAKAIRTDSKQRTRRL